VWRECEGLLVGVGMERGTVEGVEVRVGRACGWF